MFLSAMILTAVLHTSAASTEVVPVSSVASVATTMAQAAKAPAPEGPGFLEQYFPFGVADSAPQVVKDAFLLSQVLGILLFFAGGSLWAPLVTVQGADLSGDTVISWLVPAASTVGALILVGGTLTVAAFALSFLGCPLGFCAYPILIPIGLAGGYISTNATLNGIARNTFGANTKGAKGTPGVNTKVGGQPTAGGGGGGAATPSYAY
jgi:hypothetical protein